MSAKIGAVPTNETRYRTLLQARELVNDDLRLVALLGCDQASLEKWLRQDEPVPSYAFITAADIVLKERKKRP